MRPWNQLIIEDCRESLISIPLSIHRLEPHPYLSLGAPYGTGVDPWRLRVDVVKRLLIAQEYLYTETSQLRLAVFDAWRPISVQRFMVDYVIEQQCLLNGVDSSHRSNNLPFKQIVDEVNKFWAPASLNPSTPPPHSTGAAVDLTLIDGSKTTLDMGGEIDEIGPISFPDYYANSVAGCTAESCKLFHYRRSNLRTAMEKAGFVQHPNEWWHFSFGDQLWAWLSNSSRAIYGSCSGEMKLNIDSSLNPLM
tara:strand:+ start:5183 stop:5932 length:750 start_codon:yes stop_codon:yes gene_type:complete